MKKLTKSIGLLAAVTGVVIAFAMAPAPKQAVKSGSTNLYWFDPEGNPDGIMDEATKRAQCGEGQVLCSLGFASVHPETGEPEGTPIQVDGKQN